MMSPETENSLNMADVRCRTPVLVEEASSPSSSSQSQNISRRANGFGLPDGWTASGSGQQKTSTISSLKQGQTTLFAMDFYRPSIKHIAEVSDFSDDRLGDVSICKTDFYLSIKYKQLRQREKKASLKMRARKRPSRRRPVMPSKAANGSQEAPLIESTSSNQEGPEGDEYEDVSLEYSGSLCWVNSLIARFDRGQQQPASGVKDASQTSPFIVIDGSCLTIRCTLSHDPSIANMRTEIVSVSFLVSHTVLKRFFTDKP
jgi:hypothetical protein